VLPTVKGELVSGTTPQGPLVIPRSGLGRRAFISGSTVSIAGLVIIGCGDDDDEPAGGDVGAENPEVTIDFADGDGAIANFAYALEQLEAAFYMTVNGSLPSGLDRDAKQTLEDIGAHEIAHRDHLKAILGKDAIPALEVNFEEIDFADKDSVLETARTFEDLGVSAYNGAAQFLSGDGPLGLAPLQLAGEIVSVEARHASAIRTLISGNNSGDFAPNAFDEARLPGEVLQMAAPFIKTKIALRNAPAQAAS